MNTEQTQNRKKWSFMIGFLTILLFGIFWVLTAAAAQGNVIGRWILIIIFGAIAIYLASSVFGYIILLILGTTEKKENTPLQKQNKNQRKIAKRSRGRKKK